MFSFVFVLVFQGWACHWSSKVGLKGHMGGTLGHMWGPSWLQVPLWSVIGWSKVPPSDDLERSMLVNVGGGERLAAEVGLSGGGEASPPSYAEDF